ncbi:hypothetical protein AZI87_16900 [Bdellovibrio bacteriovorus]|uniref:Cell wall surface anchor family protein n=1 Tax=Bdellovibrio bacteriovorus TaxID=959 RepID=A0A162G0C3_BDEBC|nr:hypothetical protein [Bdellovibrio bacteriovorus]KYG62939.1 hypothetical protein AZI87_16900 [Bdellovibrio bacteriovorus]
MLSIRSTLEITSALLLAVPAWAQMSVSEVPQGLTIQGRIIQPDGLPLEDSNVHFNIKVLSPGAEACVLFEENRVVNMTNSKGVINFAIGAGEAGATVVPSGHTLPLHKILKNSGTIAGLASCAGGQTSYAPNAGDSRKVRVTFTVGSETVALSPDFDLRSVPYAMESENAVALEGKKAADFIQASANVTQNRVETLLLPANFDGLLALLNPSASSPTTGSIGIPSSDGTATAPVRDGLMRYDEATQTVQVSIGGTWQNVVTGNTGVGSSNIEDGSVGAADIADNAISGGKILNNAVTTDKLADEAVTSDKLMNNSVTNGKIADGAITFNKIANGAISTIKIVDGAVNSAKILDGSIATADLANSAVTTAKIADSNITTAKIADQNVTTAKIADGNVTTDKIADQNVTTAKIADSNVTTAKIANSAVTTAKIADGNVTTAKIADANVTTAKIADGNVTDAKIASVSGSKVTGNIPGNAAGFYGALAGDVVGGQSGTTVQRVQGRWVANVNPGVGQVLKWDGGQWVPQADNNSGGTITSVSVGPGMWGGGSSGGVSIGLNNTGVGAGWYGNGSYVPQFYVDSYGRITAVNNVAVNAGYASCGGNLHGRAWVGSSSCSSATISQCVNGSTVTVGTFSVPSSCDGDGDGF